MAETTAGRIVAGTAYVPLAEDVLAGLLAKPLSPLPAHYGPVARLCGTCIDPDFARRGLARLMILTAEADMASAGFGVAEVLTTLDAEGLWLAAGFVAIEDHSVLLPECAAAALPLRRLARPLLTPATLRQSRGRPRNRSPLPPRFRRLDHAHGSPDPRHTGWHEPSTQAGTRFAKVNLPDGRRFAVRRMAKGLVERPPLVAAA